MCCCKKLSEGAAEKFAELDAFIDTLNVISMMSAAVGD